KRVGRQHFPTFLLLLAWLATAPGDETIKGADRHEWLRDLRVLAVGLGLEKRFTLKEDQLEYYLSQVLLPQLRWILRRLQEVRWESLLEHATDFDLLQTRDELLTWLMQASSARRYQDRHDDEYPRWAVDVRDTFNTLPIPEQAMALAGWLALRSYSPSWL